MCVYIETQKITKESMQLYITQKSEKEITVGLNSVTVDEQLQTKLNTSSYIPWLKKDKKYEI